MPRILALLSGLLLALSFPKFGHPAVAWIAIAPLIVAVAIRVDAGGARRFSTFRLGALTGVVYFAGTLYWVTATMTTFGGLSIVSAVLVALLLVVYLAIYPGLFAVMTGVAIRRLGVRGVWLAPIFWVATEWLRATLMTGFPWVLLGTSQANVTPVAQFASVGGVYGLSFIVALVSAAAAAVSLSRRRAHLVGAFGVVVLLALIAGAGMVRVSAGLLTHEGRVLRVGLVQANIDETAKWSAESRQPVLDRYLTLSRQLLTRGTNLVVWPESATPFYFEIESAFADPIRRMAAQARTPFILGTDELTRQINDGKITQVPYNAAVLVGSDGLTRGTYRKTHLVPFGEYVPLKHLLFFVGPLVNAVSDFAAGTDPTIFDLGADAGGGRVSVAICYESIYPAISRTFVQRGSELLVVITNDSWFGPSSAPYQHFDQSTLRAIEEGRYLVRAANTGVSGAIDPYGRVLTESPVFEAAALTADVRLLDARTIYSRLGDVIAWFSLAASLLTMVVLRRP